MPLPVAVRFTSLALTLLDGPRPGQSPVSEKKRVEQPRRRQLPRHRHSLTLHFCDDRADALLDQLTTALNHPRGAGMNVQLEVGSETDESTLLISCWRLSASATEADWLCLRPEHSLAWQAVAPHFRGTDFSTVWFNSPAALAEMICSHFEAVGRRSD